jgi:putative transcriptional regulator
MDAGNTDLSLSGKLLIAMPAIGDSRFDSCLILLFEHSAEGAMGVIINKPMPELRFSALATHLKLPKTLGEMPAPNMPVHFGGPVETVRGFVLHSQEYHGGPSTQQVADNINLTTTLDILEDVARGQGPDRTLIALGYAGWGAGQLEREISQNAWLTGDVSVDLVFHPKDELKWTLALKSIGVNPLLLSSTAGRA